MPNKREAQRSNLPSVRRRDDNTIRFNAAAGLPPFGAYTSTSSTKPPNKQAPKMPTDVRGTMPSNQMFPRLREFANNLTPNPAEKMEQVWHQGTVGRFVGNFGDRKTPRLIARPFMNTWTGGDGGPQSTAI